MMNFLMFFFQIWKSRAGKFKIVLKILNFPTFSYSIFARSVNKRNIRSIIFLSYTKGCRQSILNFYSIKHVKLHMKNFTFTIFLLLFEIPQGNLVFLFFVISKNFVHKRPSCKQFDNVNVKEEAWMCISDSIFKMMFNIENIPKLISQMWT